MSDLVFECHAQLGIITLNRQQALNSINLEMVEAMLHQLKLWQDDPKVAVVLIKAASGKAFCAGGDIRSIYESGLKENPRMLDFFLQEYRLNYLIHSYTKPYIAWMDGITMGGGVGISLHGSLPIASERFLFAMPETGIGLFPDIGASYILARCPGEVGLYLALTGERLNAVQSLELGLIKCILDLTNFEKFFYYLETQDLKSEAHKKISEFLNLSSVHETQPFPNLEKINLHFSKSTLPEIMASLSIAADEWSLRTLDILKQKSPLSLQVTFMQMRKAKNLSLKECLEMDYRLVKYFMQEPDFYEGVRALIIDKDKNPKWQASSLNELNLAQINNLFTPKETAYIWS